MIKPTESQQSSEYVAEWYETHAGVSCGGLGLIDILQFVDISCNSTKCWAITYGIHYKLRTDK